MTDYSSRAATRRASLNTGSRMPAAAPVTIYQVNGASYQVETASMRHVRELMERLGQKMPEVPAVPPAPKQRKRTAKLAAVTYTKTDLADRRFKDMMYRRMRRALERKGAKFSFQNGMYFVHTPETGYTSYSSFTAMELACEQLGISV